MWRNCRLWSVTACGLLIVMGVGMGVGMVAGQLRQTDDDIDRSRSQFIPQDRRVQVLLDQARDQLGQQEGDHRRALDLLQQVLDEAEDTFATRSLDSSLRHEAELMLSGLTQEDRRLYEQTYGGEAQALLQASRENGSVDQFREVVRRFFLTDAGGEAAYLMAVKDMDRGALLAAVRQFERLRTLHVMRSRWEPDLTERAIISAWRAGLPQHAAERLIAAIEETPAVFDRAEHDLTTLSSLTAAADWLHQQFGPSIPEEETAVTQWLVPGGGLERNASVRPTTPIFDDAWRTAVVGSGDTRTKPRLAELQTAIDSVQLLAEQNEDLHIFPVSEPLVVGDTLLFLSYGRIKAVDAATGQFLWQAADADPVFEYLLTGLGKTSGIGRMPARGPIDDFLAQRAWLDATSTSLSSDGQRVFQVFDGGMVGPFHNRISRESSSSHPLSPRSYNRLRAYDIRTEGKLLWEVGGPNTRVALALSGTFFLGAPLAVDGALYVIGEDRGQVRLFVLDPETGEYRWSLPLLNTQIDINDDLDRRLAGLSPAYAGGLLICPTGAGLIAAVDPVQRSLEWGHLYNAPRHPAGTRQFPRGFRAVQISTIDMMSTESLLAEPRWRGMSTVLSDREVLVAPPDRAALYCLSLFDGSVQWSRPRQRTLFIAGTHDDSAILVGERSVEAVRLDSGETVWSLPMDEPSGRGVREANLYHLPLRGSEVATIDLNEGRLLAKSTTRTGAELGNLVAAGGRLFTQSTSEVRGFRSLSEVRQQIAADLSGNPQDPAALAVRGELRLHAGNTSDGLADLRTSLAVAPDGRVQQLIVETMLERLRTNFVAHQQIIPELEDLAIDPAQHIRLIRTVAAGLETVGEPREAFREYLRLLTLDSIADMTEHVSDTRSVRLDRWAQGQLLRLYESTSVAERESLDRHIEDAVRTAMETESIGLLTRLTSTFRQSPSGKLAQETLTTLIDPQTSPLRAEALYLEQRRHGTPAQRANATARLVRLYAGYGRGTLVRSLLDELANDHTDVPAAEGLTGAELADDWRDDDVITEALKSVIDWPTESIHVTKGQGNTRPPPHPLVVLGPVDPLFSDGGFLSDMRGQSVTAYDGYGRKESSQPIRSPVGVGMPDTHFARRRGHRALVFLGHHFRLFNMLSPEQAVTIHEDAVTNRTKQSPFGRSAVNAQHAGRGLRGNVLLDQSTGEYLGTVGPLGDELFCYQKGGTLYAIDPYSGDELWHVDDAPRGSEIFLDHEYVVLVPHGRRAEAPVAHVLRAADGELIGQTKLPVNVERNRHQADWGRLFLTRQSEADGVTLAMFDPVSGENVWERMIPKFVDWVPLDGRDLVVVNEDGQLQILQATDGEVRFETQVELPENIRSVSVLSLPNEWVLLTYQRPDGTQLVKSLLPSSQRQFDQVNGVATAFDRRTNEQLWSREILSQLVDPSLPGRWPLLVFATDAQVVRTPIQPGLRYKKLLLLDKRTGQTIFDGEGDVNRRWQGAKWTVSEETPQLRLSFAGTDLIVTFREDAPAESDEEDSSRSGGNVPSPPTSRPPAPPSPGPED